MKLISAAALLLSAHTVFGTGDFADYAWGRQLVGASCDAVTSCDDSKNTCNTINGHKYWSVSIMTDKDCLTRCVDGRDLAYMKSIGYSCGPCPEAKCDAVHQCALGFNIFRIEDGKCKDECVKDQKVERKLRDKKPWSCGKCDQPVDITTRSGDKAQKIDCASFAPGDPAAPLICSETPPAPDKCLLRDHGQKALKVSPTWWDSEVGVYVELQVKKTGNIYKWGNVTGALGPTPQAEFPINNDKVLQEIRDGNGIQMRFGSARGLSGWTKCAYDPVAFDLDMNGNIDIIDNLEFQMDITGDGVTETLHQWFGPHEGILLFLGKKLKNKDLASSIAVSGQQLMGDMGGQYADGYDKLKDYDRDDNKIIEGKEMKGFYLWIDVNSNYKLDQGELHELSEYDITGFSIVGVNHKSQAFKKDGSIMLTQDIWLER